MVPYIFHIRFPSQCKVVDSASPLFVACQYGHHRLVNLLIQHGAFVRILFGNKLVNCAPVIRSILLRVTVPLLYLLQVKKATLILS